MDEICVPEAAPETAVASPWSVASDGILAPAEAAAPRGTVTWLAVVSCCVFLLLLVGVYLCIRHLNDGHFVYALDDPYIHLALSEQIAHGHYGINPTEYSSPSSSILWPFLLAVFAGTAIHPYVPLLLSAAAGLVAVYMLAWIVERMNAEARTGYSRSVRFIAVLLLMFCGNLISLPFLGLEHELQVMLAIVCSAGLCEVWSGRPMPVWAMAAAAVGPLIRYESLAITVAVAVTLAAMRHRRSAMLVLAGALIPMASFSIYLRHLGLKMLPSSVLLKSGQESIRHTAAGHLFGFIEAWIASFKHPARWPVAVLACILVYLFIRQPVRRRKVVLAAAILVAMLQELVGAFGAFHRYEVYAAAFLSILLLRAVWPSHYPIRIGWVLAALFCLATPYLAATWGTPISSHQVYCQQYQMRRFVDQYYRRDFAINDLGLVSYRRPAGVYVLDLWGLAWYEAGVVDRTPEWLAHSVAERHVGLAMLYSGWFRIPPSWTHIGELCIDRPPVVLGGQCVAFYGTTPAAAAELEPELRRFAPTLPSGSTFRFGPPPSRTQGRLPLLRRLLSNLGL